MKKILCHISKKLHKHEEVHRGDFIRKEIMGLIKKDFPDFNHESYICIEELNRYRKIYLASLIKTEVGEINALEKEVIEAISKNKILTENIETDFEKKLTFGEKLADSIAKFGGSWIFIVCFFVFLLGWIVINIWLFTNKPFDPYPFILLNLILSCLAAIQAPIIIMSQNRLEEKDRRRGEHDFKINLKAELEIRFLNEKIDHLMVHQYQRMLDIQQLQTDYLEDILKKEKTKS